jgi:hypothetical protein
MNKKKKIDKTDGINHGLGTHPGAYIDDYDTNNELLDTVDSADDIFTENIPGHKKRANHASPSAADPPVPNRAHTEM